MRTAIALANLHICLVYSEPSSQFKILIMWPKWRLDAFYASSEDSGESAQFHRLTLAFVTVQNLFCCIKCWFVCFTRQQWILWWVCTFGQAKTLDNEISIKISCAGSEGSWGSTRLHRLAWAFVTVSKISCAGWNGDFCYVYVTSECCC